VSEDEGCRNGPYFLRTPCGHPRTRTFGVAERKQYRDVFATVITQRHQGVKSKQPAGVCLHCADTARHFLVIGEKFSCEDPGGT